MKRVALMAMTLLLLSGASARAGIREESVALVEAAELLDAYARTQTNNSQADRQYRRQVAQLEEASRRVQAAVESDASPSRVAQTLKDTAAIHYEVIAASGPVVFTKEAYKALRRFEIQFRRVGEKFTYYAATPSAKYR